MPKKPKYYARLFGAAAADNSFDVLGVRVAPVSKVNKKDGQAKSGEVEFTVSLELPYTPSQVVEALYELAEKVQGSI